MNPLPPGVVNPPCSIWEHSCFHQHFCFPLALSNRDWGMGVGVNAEYHLLTKYLEHGDDVLEFWEYTMHLLIDLPVYFQAPTHFPGCSCLQCLTRVSGMLVLGEGKPDVHALSSERKS